MSKTNIPEMSIGKAIDQLSNVYVSMVNAGVSFKDIPSVFLWGPPGSGKSAGIYQVAERIEKETGKRVVVTDIRLLMYGPTDLMGMPTSDANKEFAIWLKPRILNMDPSEDVINLLFLDELSSAPPAIQTIAYQMTLDRAVGEHKFPDNTIVVAAGNRTSDKAVAYKMPSPLANRMMHFEIIGDDFKSWSQWAIENTDIHPLVLGYLSFDVNKLYVFEKDPDIIAFPTPRSWMFVSNMLNLLGVTDDLDGCLQIIASIIGMPTAISFVAWSKVYKKLPPIEEIFTGRKYDFPKTPDVLYAVITSATKYAVMKEKGESRSGLTASEIEYMCQFALALPVDYAVTFMLNVSCINSIKMKLIKNHSFMDWAKHNRKALATAGLGI